MQIIIDFLVPEAPYTEKLDTSEWVNSRTNIAANSLRLRTWVRPNSIVRFDVRRSKNDEVVHGSYFDYPCAKVEAKLSEALATLAAVLKSNECQVQMITPTNKGLLVLTSDTWKFYNRFLPTFFLC
jgi:hypothetical protein